jgi:hypothetical protein
MATGKIKVNFKMPTPSAADRMYAKHQAIRKAAGLPDVDNNPDRPDAGKYSSDSSKPVKRVTPVATPSVNEADITVVKKGTGIKKKISDISYGVFKSHGFVKESFRIGGMGSRGANVHMYDRNPGPKDGSELENIPSRPKTELQKRLKAALADFGDKMKKTHPKLREEKDSQEYDYEGDMAKSDLRSIIHNAQTLHDMIDDDTNLAEWCQSKITLAEDYISTVTNYMRSEMNEEVELLDENEDKANARKMYHKHFVASMKSMASSPKQKHHQAEMAKYKAMMGDSFVDQVAPKKFAKFDKKTNEEVELDEVAAWQRKEGKNPEGGLNQKGIASYRAENPGSKLSTAVTTEPSKLKAGSKSANRRKSFCARMSGMKRKLTSAKTASDPDSRINKSLRKWNC